MSRKTDSHHGLHDVIGVALLALALLIFAAQISFDSADISHLTFPPNKSAHNWIGPLGAYLAWGFFLPLGVVAYFVPPLLAFFGAAYLLDFLSYVRERLRWSLLWSIMLLVALTGLLYIADNGGARGGFPERIGSLSAGGWLGWLTYGQTQNYNFGIAMLGTFGAIIIYTTLGLISLLFLTNFHLGVWVRALLQKEKSGKAVIEDEPEKS
ncbi:MAG TPA: DNA translocase FtsK 4TM domain-containing protein, partial [Candidatus Baltobacteraceae bacterium]|nr:DNA translocase FtsK 4TM domain-containing protein [Candidatus Baltobacteraceae bacterium]